MYQDTGEERYIDMARKCEKKLEQTFSDFYGLHHDVGFMFLPAVVADYRITGNEEAKKAALHAANLLAGRFNPQGNYIRAWNDLPDQDTRGWAIIDCMFNISLLYWASKETGDPRYRHIAMRHADSVMTHFIRKDGSVIHIGEFDPETGAFVKSHGGQGYGEGSAWTGAVWLCEQLYQVGNGGMFQICAAGAVMARQKHCHWRISSLYWIGETMKPACSLA